MILRWYQWVKGGNRWYYNGKSGIGVIIDMPLKARVEKTPVFYFNP